MLRTQSFKMSEGDTISEILKKYPLAKGMHVFVSDGELVIPFEDGEPETTEVKVITIKEQVNTIEAQKELIVQSQMVLEAMIDKKKTRLNELQANLAEAEKSANSKGKTQQIKEMKDVEAKALNHLKEEQTQYMMNERELERLDLNVEMLNKRIEEISA